MGQDQRWLHQHNDATEQQQKSTRKAYQRCDILALCRQLGQCGPTPHYATHLPRIRGTIPILPTLMADDYVLEFITIWVILCLSRKEAQTMLRYQDLSTSTTDVLDLTSVTIDEF